MPENAIKICLRTAKDAYTKRWIETVTLLGQSRTFWASALIVSSVKGEHLDTGRPYTDAELKALGKDISFPNGRDAYYLTISDSYAIGAAKELTNGGQSLARIIKRGIRRGHSNDLPDDNNAFSLLDRHKSTSTADKETTIPAKPLDVDAYNNSWKTVEKDIDEEDLHLELVPTFTAGPK